MGTEGAPFNEVGAEGALLQIISFDDFYFIPIENEIK